MTDPIVLQDVERYFGERCALSGLTLRVGAGEAFALLGRNGAGKTTAIRTLLGLLGAHGGEARVLGVPSTELDPQRRERIGYIAEGHTLHSRLRLEHLLDFEAGTRERFDRELVERAAARLDLPLAGRIHRLSRGQQAQVSLLLAVAGRPELLVFDDPAMGLDAVVRRELLDTLIELLASRGASILYSSHILTDVERVADRVGILRDGRLIVDARIDELKQRVEKRFLFVEGGATRPSASDVPGLLRAHRRPEGFELTLLDVDPERMQALAALGGRLSEPQVPTLEELFCDLTATSDEGVLAGEEVFA